MFSLYFLERMKGAGFLFKTRSCRFYFEERTLSVKELLCRAKLAAFPEVLILDEQS